MRTIISKDDMRRQAVVESHDRLRAAITACRQRDFSQIHEVDAYVSKNGVHSLGLNFGVMASEYEGWKGRARMI